MQAPSRLRDTVNGKLQGIYYVTEHGARVYLAHRQLRHLNTKYNGWTLPLATLNRCRDRGFLHVGVVCRRGGRKQIWITPIEDFFHPEKSFASFGKMGLERGVRIKHFAVNPAIDPGKIDGACSIG
jgi:hypothetical protein